MQADYPLILLLVSIDIICMWEVYENRERVENALNKIVLMHNARKAARKEKKAEKKAAAVKAAETEVETAAETGIKE